MAALTGKKPDRMPWAPIITDYTLSFLPEHEQDNYTFTKKIGADYAKRWVPSYKGFGINSDLISSKITQKVIIKDNLTITEYSTPMGVLKQTVTYSEQAGITPYIIEHYIKTENDIAPYTYLWESMDPQADYGKTSAEIESIGEDGIAMITVPSTPILQLIMFDMGLAAFNYFLVDYPEKMKKLLDIMTEKTLTAAKLSMEAPGYVRLIPENSGTRLVSPSQFKEHCLPVLQEFSKLSRLNDKKLLMHACGHLKLLMPMIAQSGIDGIESLSSPPTGDTEPEYARELMGDEAVFFGGIDPVEFQSLKSDILAVRVEQVIERNKDNPRFVLMPSDSTPPNVPMENYKVVIETLKRMYS